MKKLPIIFVCEDNGLAIQMPTPKRRGYKSLTNIVSGFDCIAFETDTTDVKKIYELAKNAVDHIRDKGGPVFLNLRYCRYFDHVGVETDFKDGYRSEEEFKKWQKRDPLKIQREFMIRDLEIGMNEILALEGEIENQVSLSVAMAKLSPFPKKNDLERDIFHV